MLDFFLCVCSVVAIVNAQVTITTSPEDAALAVGQNLTITCADNSATFTVALQINGEDASNNPKVIDTTPNQAQTKTFLFTSVETSDDGLRFTCVISAVSQTSEEVILDVLTAPILSNINDVTEVVGQNAVVMFSVDANPPVAVNNVSITPSRSPAPVISVNGTSVTVEFENLQLSDAGTYTVTVINDIGSDMEMFAIIVNNAEISSTSVSPTSTSTSVSTRRERTSTSSSSSSVIIRPTTSESPTGAGAGLKICVSIVFLLLITSIFVIN